MRKLAVVEYMSLDGVVQAPGHAGEDPEDGFVHGGWTGPFMGARQRKATVRPPRPPPRTGRAAVCGQHGDRRWLGHPHLPTDLTSRAKLATEARR